MINYTWMILSSLCAICVPCLFGVIGYYLPRSWLESYKRRDISVDVAVTFLSLSLWIIVLALVISSHISGVIRVDATYYNESLVEILLLSTIIILFGIHGSFQVGLWRLRR